MRIAIVSDTHDNWPNFKKAIDWIKNEKISLILHCGDVCNKDTVDKAIKCFNGAIKFAKGNGDYGLDFSDKIELELDNKKIFFCHFPDIAKKMAQSGKFDLVFYGHTHRPWDERVGECHMINPGELAGQFYKSTFAIYDTKKSSLELKIVDYLE